MKNFLSTILCLSISLFCSSIFISCDNSSKELNDPSSSEIPELHERAIQTGGDEELNAIKTTYDNASIAIENNPQDYKSYLTLATVFINEARITGDLSYYNTAALKMVDKIIQSKQSNTDIEFQALSYKSAIYLSMHQFKDALILAKQALVINDKNSGVYGALVDANVELGNYAEAVAMSDKMMQMKPDIRSYSRVSYLRQIYGDNRGAIEAMNYAVSAGLPGAENTEWARVNLGDLFLNIGKLDTAEMIYNESLARRPNYAFAEMGLAKIEKAKGNYDAAIQHSENAIKIMSESAFISFLGDCYLLKGDSKKAEEIYEDVLKLLEESEEEQNNDKSTLQHNGARELATAQMKVGNLDEALRYAKKDLEMRPENIDANELIAWIYYLKGDFSSAKVHVDKMLATKTQNANSLYKASLIYAKAGESQQSFELMAQAKLISPYIDSLLN